MQVLGRHILVEFYGCSNSILNDQYAVQQYMEQAAIASDATIVKSVFHRFSPHGVSGVVVIAESHLAIHTWPEYNYAAVDLFTCGSRVDPWAAFDVLKERLLAADFYTTEFKRGLPGAPDTTGDIRLRHKPQAPACP